MSDVLSPNTSSRGEEGSGPGIRSALAAQRAAAKEVSHSPVVVRRRKLQARRDEAGLRVAATGGSEARVHSVQGMRSPAWRLLVQLWRIVRRLAILAARFLSWAWWHIRIDPTGHTRPYVILSSFVGGLMIILMMASMALTATVPHLIGFSTVGSAASSAAGAAAGAVKETLTNDDGKKEDEAEKAGRSAAVVGILDHDVQSLYREAANSCGLEWQVLAAVGWVESHHGTLDAPGVHSGVNYAGAAGPMQFMAPTWAAYGVDADHNGIADVYNQKDATYGAANYLCKNGAAKDAKVRDALYNYNHSDAYVDEVMKVADEYRDASYVLPLSVDALKADALSRPHHDYPAIDISVPVGTSVYAVHAGKVHKVKDGACGYGVIIDGTDGARYTYCHGSKLDVGNGDTVKAGELIMHSGGKPGAAGAGDSTGPHLHFAVEVDGRYVCPQSLLSAWKDGEFKAPADGKGSGCSY